ncbi:MAG TPA: M56 family metallopeptidase [Thermoanaerobaculia bacterium]|jgi:beta-lactamase regulating signal transducer with metallopeptidase domain
MSDPLTFAFTLRALEIHLTFATLVALAAWAVTSSPPFVTATKCSRRVVSATKRSRRVVSATTKYWIWVATSLNFLLPAGVFVDRLRPPNLAWVLPLEDFGSRISRDRTVGMALAAVWVIGAALMLARLAWRIRADRGRLRLPPATQSRSGLFARGVPVRFDAEGAAPAVDGLFRPRISLPAGIEHLLTPPELDAVLIHELTHARRRDNLIRLAHEIGVCVFWFHPMVWVAGSRLSLYRELSCDESVIRRARGGDLVSALAKLTNPAETLLLQSGASSFLADRVASLAVPRRISPAASTLQAVLFGLLLLASILGSAFQANLMRRASLGEFCPRLRAELAAATPAK